MPTIEELAAQISALEQQVAAIITPPDKYYTSIYSGEEIDAAITKVRSGAIGVSSFNGRSGAVMPQAGDYNATEIPVSGDAGAETVSEALDKKAPAGYGFGEIAKQYIFNDDTDGSKFIAGMESVIQGISAGTTYLAEFQNYPYLPSDSFRGLIWRTGTRVCIFGWNYNGNQISRIFDDNTGWEPWEWVNPPMLLGVEYRTTERYNGKPVYVKLVDFGLLPNNTTKTVSYEENASLCIDVKMILSGQSWKVINSIISRFTGSRDSIMVTTIVDGSVYGTANVSVKYTKTTD